MRLLAPGGAPKSVPVEPELLGRLRTTMAALTARDWQEAEQGLYPESLLFDAAWLDWAARYPLVWLDMPSTWARRTDHNVRGLKVFKKRQASAIRVLDVASGTGRTLRRLRGALPFADGSFQAVSCVFLLHELPGEARQNVIQDAWRVLEPGGL